VRVPDNVSGPRWPIYLIRGLAVIILLQVLVQAGLAGGFISGDVSLLGLHTANGILLVPVSVLLLPAAFLLWRPGRGPFWPVVFGAVYWLVIGAQVGFGFARKLGLHVPLGVAAFGLIAAFTWWSFAYRPAPVLTPVTPVAPVAS
jgi:hypothetical protein